MPPAIENHYCDILTDEENVQIFKLLGNRCQSLCTTVVQLYLTTPPDHSKWIKKTTGVLCFVKDNTKKNFFFRLFSIDRNIKLWEHEMYNHMDYIEATPFFHMFEGENCHVAFNFASIQDARDLRIVVNQKVNARKKREDKKNKVISQSQTLPPPTTQLNFNNYRKTLDPASQQAKRRRNITKADIGIPRDFKHISHVGWDSTHGFDVNTEDESLKAFFKKAGVSEQQLQDKSTRDFIYDYINRNGGREAIEQTNKTIDTNTAPPAVPPRGPPVSRPSHFRNAPPPPIPNKTPNANNNATPRKPRMDVPPPKKPAPVPNFGTPPSRDSVPAAPPAPAPPPPPPLPPMMDEVSSPKESLGPPPPPMGPLSPGPAAGAMGNAALLESIRNGTTLKSVDDRKAPPPQQEDARGDLLSEIRKGCKLRPVDERDIKPAANPLPSRSDDLASALARALAKRSEVIHSEDDKSDESTDSEWDC
ncbi:actin nucleation-promoting factor WASL-like isoform X1 [Diabrotica virgifera virgifera]|uniref:Neural Wiskott-Aldrich syndrome protein-like n=2 Tax=Diabrotica virgifera virgifera TaxID=50390 RepID=A0A6P7GH47_DIAVI|nr:actin nucleation-promoting factor WASL-like isoform X1 [Diabrotica virgifera virgifera]